MEKDSSKISDLPVKEETQAREVVEAAGEVLGLNTYNSSGETIPKDVDIYGICKKCQNLDYIKYEFHGQLAYCRHHEAVLSGVRRILECSSFDKRGRMTLTNMMDIAYDLSYLSQPDHKRAGLV